MIKAFQWAKEARIQTFAYLIIGYLGETENTARQTIDFVKKIKPTCLCTILPHRFHVQNFLNRQ